MKNKLFEVKYWYWCVFDDEDKRHKTETVEAVSEDEAKELITGLEAACHNDVEIDVIKEIKKENNNENN